MIVIEICSAQVETREFAAKEGGRLMRFREQRAYLHKQGDPYPSPFVISLGDRLAYSPGRYQLMPDSFRIGRFGSLELTRELRLEPVPVSESPPRPAVAASRAAS